MLLQLVGRSLTLNEMVANRGRGSAQNARTSDCTVSEASGARYACRWGRLLNIPVARILARLFATPGARRDTSLFTNRAYLSAYLTARGEGRVYVCVGSARADSGDNRGKVTRRELLWCHRPLYDVCGCDRPGHGALLRALRSKAGRIGITAVWQRKMTMLPFTPSWATWMWDWVIVPCSPLNVSL